MFKKTLFLYAIITLSLSVSAQNSNDKLVEKLVEKGILTQNEAKDIIADMSKENEKELSAKDWESVKKMINNKYLQLGGYSQLLYTYSNTQVNKHEGEVRNVFLSIKGEPLKDLKYLVFANLRNPSLTEYYVDWTPLEEVKFRVGQQKVPLSIENQLSLSALEFIQNSRSVNYLIGGSKDVLTLYNGKSSGGRDMGVKAYGKLLKLNGHSFIEYDLGIYQGSGINKSSPRSDKDFITNILLSPIEGLRVGGGIQFGGTKYQTPEEIIPSVHVRNRWIISSDFKYNNFYARAEWIEGNDSGIKKEGVYGMCSWSFIPNRWVLLAKVDYYNNNKKIGIEAMDYSTGINFILNKYCRLQANYTYSDYSKKWGEKNSHLVEAQFQIIY